MKFPLSARVGVYLVLFGILFEILYITWLYKLPYPYLEPFIPLGIAMLLAYGVGLFIRPTIAQGWERDDLFERARQRGFIATANLAWEPAPNRAPVPRVSPLRRGVPLERYCLKLSSLALIYSIGLVVLFAILLAGIGFGRSWRAAHRWGLKVLVLAPSAQAAPGEPLGQKLVVKIVTTPRYFVGSKPVSKSVWDRAYRRFPWREDRLPTVTRGQQWFLNSKPMTKGEVLEALREELPRRRLRYVYLDVDRDAQFNVTAHAIEAVQQAPDTRVVLVTDEDKSR